MPENLLYPHQVFKFPTPEQQAQNNLINLHILGKLREEDENNRLMSAMQNVPEGITYESLSRHLRQQGLGKQALALEKEIGQEKLKMENERVKERMGLYQSVMKTAIEKQDNTALQSAIEQLKKDPDLGKEFKDFEMKIEPKTGEIIANTYLDENEIEKARLSDPDNDIWKLPIQKGYKIVKINKGKIVSIEDDKETKDNKIKELTDKITLMDSIPNTGGRIDYYNNYLIPEIKKISGIDLPIIKDEKQFYEAEKTLKNLRQNQFSPQVSLQWLKTGEKDNNGDDLFELYSVDEVKMVANPVPKNTGERNLMTHEEIMKSEAKKLKSVELDPLTKKLEENLGKEFGKSLIESKTMARKSLVAINAIDTAMKSLKEGMYTGYFANVKTNLAKIISEMGIEIGGEKTANTETYEQVLNRLTGPIVADFNKGTVSDADREFGMKIAGGDITLQKESLEKLLKINREIESKKIEAFNMDIERIGKYDKKIKDYFEKINIPESKIESKETPTKIEDIGKYKIEKAPPTEIPQEKTTRDIIEKAPPEIPKTKISPEPLKEDKEDKEVDDSFIHLKSLFSKLANRDVIKKEYDSFVILIKKNIAKDSNKGKLYSNKYYNDLLRLENIYKEWFGKDISID